MYHIDLLLSGKNLKFSLLQRRLEPLLNSLHILPRGNPRLAILASSRQRQVLGHNLIFIHGINASLFQCFCECDNLRGTVDFTALNQSSSPGEDGGDGVGGCFATLLVFAVVTGDGAVGGFGFECGAVGGCESGGHET